MKFGIALVATACLMVSTAQAQQTQFGTDRATQSTQSQDLTNERPGTNSRDINDQSPSATSQFGANPRTATGANEQVQNYVVACMLGKNKAEIELAQFAQQQAENPEVKEFAQQMVQDHQKIVQQLQGLAGNAHTGSSATTTGQSPTDAQRQASDTTRLPGSPGAGQRSESATITGSSNRDASNALAGAGNSNEAIMKLMKLEQQITQQCAQALQQELQQKRGAEFDKAYVGSQIGSHMQALAALKVIGEQGPQQLQRVAQQAQPTIQQHLEHAKQLMAQLEETGPASSQAERQSPRTQR
jgi:predicted outer membrane protein